jgi:acyl carrier protein
MDSAKVRELVLEKTANLAGVSLSDITAETNLESLGLDSADAVVLAMEIEQATGHEIEVGLFLRCETIDEAAGEVAKLVESGAKLMDSEVGSGPKS